MLEHGRFSVSENEHFIGFTMLECAKKILLDHSEIEQVHLRPYLYIPESDISEKRISLTTKEFLEGITTQEMIKSLKAGGILLWIRP